MILPDALDDDLIEILGMPNFSCGPCADVLRASGSNIPRRAEAEQAHMIFYLLGRYAKYGSAWRANAETELQDMVAKANDRRQEPKI